MKTYEISYNSKTDLERQLKQMREKHPEAIFDESQIDKALAQAMKMDNDSDTTGSRATFKINF